MYAVRKGTGWAVHCEHAKVVSMAWLQPSQLRGMYTGPLTGNANRDSEGTVSICVCCFCSFHREMFPKKWSQLIKMPRKMAHLWEDPYLLRHPCNNMGLFLPGKAVFIQSGSESNKTVMKSKGRVDPVYCSLLIGYSPMTTKQ